MERERAVRFSNLEIEVLVDLIKAHITFRETRTDCAINAVQRRPWEDITAEFSSRTSTNRTKYQLFQKWKNLKHAARKYEAAMNNKDESTRGQGSSPRSPILEEVLDIIRREQKVSAQKNSREIDPTMCLATKIKVEEIDDHSEAIDSQLPSDTNSKLSQESYNHSTHDACSTVQAEIQEEHTLNNREKYADLLKLVQEKDLALKSAQLILLEKEKRIKDLDIRIREEQLNDIIIRRSQEQELLELRRRRIQHYLNVYAGF